MKTDTSGRILTVKLLWKTLLVVRHVAPGSISYSHPRLHPNSFRVQYLMNIAEPRNKLLARLRGEFIRWHCTTRHVIQLSPRPVQSC
jgi:hypothetical protein